MVFGRSPYRKSVLITNRFMVRTKAVGVMFFFQAEDGIRDIGVTGVQTCALPISTTSCPSPTELGRGLIMDLQTLWFAAVAVLWTGFLLLEGFDFGVAALLPVLGRRTSDRHLMLRSIGPLWDGNEVWLITAAGAVFAAFPGWYATWLPALYLPFVLVLFGLIIRAVACGGRHSPPPERWDTAWTRVIPAGSLIAALGIGAALGATTLGLPIDGAGHRVGGAFAGLGWPALL